MIGSLLEQLNSPKTYELNVVAGLRAGLHEERTGYLFEETGSRTGVDLSILFAV